MELAFSLRLPLYELLAQMSFKEYLMWAAYFEQRPPGWREDDRTFKMMKALGAKANAGDVFPSLGVMLRNREATSNVPRKGTLIHSMMMKARGGDSPDFLKDL